jgi:hypothetical protein
MVIYKTLKAICCEGSSVGTFTDLVNGLVRQTCSSQNFLQTYEKGSVDGVMGRLS